MKVVITSATEREVSEIKHVFQPDTLVPAGMHLSYHESGVGVLSSCFSLSRLIFEMKPDLIIQAGIAGTFNPNLALGKVVVVRDEILADLGVEENRQFLDVFDLGLQQKNCFPYTEGKLSNTYLPELNKLELEEVTAITINEITTLPDRIEIYKNKFAPVTESMEGAALHYCCLQSATPFIQVRAISNYVGERNKSKWNFKDALHNLAVSVTDLVKELPAYKIE